MILNSNRRKQQEVHTTLDLGQATGEPKQIRYFATMKHEQQITITYSLHSLACRCLCFDCIATVVLRIQCIHLIEKKYKKSVLNVCAKDENTLVHEKLKMETLFSRFHTHLKHRREKHVQRKVKCEKGKKKRGKKKDEEET